MMKQRVGSLLSIASAPPSAGAAGVLRDVIALSKPGIVAMCLVTSAAGAWLAGAPPSGWIFVSMLLGTALCVGSANAFNMLIERRSDARMQRTRQRPLPAGRVAPWLAATVALVSGLVGLALLWIAVNPLSALLAALALDTYVLLYTPLKRKTHLALYVGAIPGAIPPVIGWSSVAGELQTPALLLFAVLVLWQIPHFLAIALYRKEDYRRGGIQVLPNLPGGEDVARWLAILTSALLGVAAVSLASCERLGWLFLCAATVTSTWFLISAFRNLRPPAGTAGARRFFFATLLYLPLLVSALALDRVLGQRLLRWLS